MAKIYSCRTSRQDLVELLRDCAYALDSLAGDAEELGYTARAECAADLAMQCRDAIQDK